MQCLPIEEEGGELLFVREPVPLEDLYIVIK